MGEVKVRLIDNSFSAFTKSASLREENKDVTPTYFQWPIGQSYPHGENVPTFYTDNAILTRDSFAPNAIAWLLEPRCLRPENYEAAKEKAHHFKAVLSYDQELIQEIENGRLYPLGGSSISFSRWGIYPKTKDVCCFVSSKRTTEGHKLRHQIIEEFGDRIDFYGEGVDRPVESKFEVLKNYRYCIVVESCDLDIYFSEKLIDVISVGTIKEQDNVLFRTSENARRRNLETAKQYRICENWIYENHGDLFS
jgi:hypothetical protein